MTQTKSQSYGRIAKSSALLGSSSLVNVLLGIVRVKVLAVELGPALFGVMSLYTGLTAMIGSVISLGIGQSAIRNIAQASGSDNEEGVARTVKVLRRTVLFTAMLGLMVTVALAYPSSIWTFGNPDHAWAIAALGVGVLLSQFQVGQEALLSGLRRINDLAKLNIFSGVWSTLLAIPLLLLFREDGIVPFLLAIAAGQLVASWWYARRVTLQPVNVTWKETATGARDMLRLGITLMLSGFLLTSSEYLVRLILQQYSGEASVGLYQSAFNISGIYIGFILQAMSGDYFPRLASVGEDLAQRTRLVNEQAEMALLLAVPGLVGVMIFSELMIWLLYSERFDGASDVLRWQVLGLLGRIISWPLGFILLARADKVAFLLSEIATMLFHIAVVWLAVRSFGVEGAGMGFLGQYLFYVGLIAWIVKVRHGHVWDKELRLLVLTGILLVVSSFATTFISDDIVRYTAGVSILILALGWSLYGITRRLGYERIISFFVNLSKRIGLDRFIIKNKKPPIKVLKLPGNHFDALRVLFAAFVIYSHSFALGIGNETSESLAWLTSYNLPQVLTFGELGVDGFFVISGFLITMSWDRRSSLPSYLNRRIGRIYPGFIVASIIGVYLIPYAAINTTDWNHIDATNFLSNILRLKGLGHPLAFADNIYPLATNGSLWSIAYEFWCYIGIILLGITGLLSRPRGVVFIFVLSLFFSYYVASTGWNLSGGILGKIFGYPPFWARLLPYYLVGVVAYRYHHVIRYNFTGFIIALLATIVLGSFNHSWSWVLPITWAYVIFYFAFFKRVKPIPVTVIGDCSYGAYLYAFPIQQLCVMAYGGSMPPMLLFAISLPVSLIAGLLSWHLVEKWFVSRRLKRRKVCIDEVK